MFASPQHLFAAALLDPERAVPPGLSVRPGARAETGFAVYRNNVTVGLIEAMRASFPLVERIVGGDFFTAMARVFVAAHPPRSPVLLDYGDDFPAFLEGFPPAAELPYLPDMARLERAHTRAYHAADAAPIGIEVLETAADLSAARLRLHPAASVIRSVHPIVSIRAMNLDLLPLGPIGDLPGEDALVSRPALEVEVRALPPGGAAFVLALGDGWTLGAAAEAALTEAADFDLARNLAGLFAAGIAIGLMEEKESPP